MSETVNLEIPGELAARARALAAATNRRFEEVVTEWIGCGAEESPMESSSDEELLALCDASLPPSVQLELSELLARNREGTLNAQLHGRLDELMTSYRGNLLAKARAWKEAVARGLRPPLSDTAA